MQIQNMKELLEKLVEIGATSNENTEKVNEKESGIIHLTFPALNIK